MTFNYQQTWVPEGNICFKIKWWVGVLYRTAKEVEAIVRAEGATPATVGVISGEVHVGLSSEELDHLAQSKISQKVSRRDLSYVISKVSLWHFDHTLNEILAECHPLIRCMFFSQGLSGGTTVSATMIAAHRAGIPVFVTGGIGGVHRDGENSELSPTFFENTFYTFSYHFTKSCAWSKQNMLSGVKFYISVNFATKEGTKMVLCTRLVKKRHIWLQLFKVSMWKDVPTVRSLTVLRFYVNVKELDNFKSLFNCI